ncbi:MAG TPA: SDR family NAD(P)-dependent oxidoreductase [bacterium]|nr:SDR family NAD(P)-dependent oxidoreductase [bacterium]
MLLQGKRAVVTGAGSGIARAVALGFARQGAAIVVADVNAAAAEKTATAIREFGGDALSVPVDVADESSVQRMAEQVLSDPRGVQILVNFAGVTHRVDFDHLDSANWDRMVAIHLKGTYLCCQAFTQALREQGGAILNMSSMFGQEGRNDGAHYAAAKAGIMGLTRALAREMGKDQVRVNALAPGPVDTPITRGGLSEEEFRKKAEGWKSRIPLGRIGVPEDLVGPSLFLVSDLSVWMTGVILPVNGGMYLS